MLLKKKGMVIFMQAFVIAGVVFPLITGAGIVQAQTIGKWDIFEIEVINSNSYSNPFDFTEIELQASFISPARREVIFFGFYDGDGNGGQTGNVWKLRFMPDEVGTWNYNYTWTDGTPGGSGNFDVVDTGLPGPLKIATDNSWYFETASGEPFHFRGYDIHTFFYYTATQLITQEIDSLLNTIQINVIDKGYNFTMMDDPSDRLHVEYGESWWLNTTDTKVFNIPVWHACEEVFELTKNNEVYVITFAGMIFQGSQYNFTDFQVFLRYWVARFAPFYNFFGWSPTWEWTDIWEPDEVNQIMQYVYDIDPWKRLLSVHDCSYSTFTGWLSFSMRQAHSNNIFLGNGRRNGQQQIYDPNGSGGIGDPFIDNPIIGSEDIWESTFSTMPANAIEVRRGAWGIQMAGVMPLYSEWTSDPPPTGGNGEGEPEVRRMFDFFYSQTRYREYQQLNDLVSSSDRQIASGIEGEEYLVYDENGGSINLDLSGTSSSDTFSVYWYDPKNGDAQYGEDVTGGGIINFVPPFSGDVVLLLKNTVVGIIEKDYAQIYPNPCRVFRGDGFITFSGNLSLGDNIKIYDTNGRLVHSSGNLSETSYEWNVSSISSGVYFFVVKSADAQRQTSGKVVVIR